MDIRAYLQAYKEVLNYPKAIALAREMKLETCLFLAFALLEHYFNDVVPVVIKQGISKSKRFSYLVNTCYKMLSRDPGYGLTISGRTNKLVYIMRLMNNMPARMDWIYGILMRFVSNLTTGHALRRT
jgi:hypothetical protein